MIRPDLFASVLYLVQGPSVSPAISANPDISLIVDTALGVFSAGEPLPGGAHDPHENGFALQQVELNLRKAVDPYFRLDASIVFGHEVEVEEAFVTTTALPGNLQLRAGQFLTRVGRINATHPHAWEFVDQALVIGQLFGGEGNRGAGLEASWLAPLPWFVELVYSATGAHGDETHRSFLGAQARRLESPLDLQNSVMAKQFFELSDNWSLAWGLSAIFGPHATSEMPADDGRAQIFGTDLYLKYRPVTFASHTMVSLQTEWFYRRTNTTATDTADVTGYAQALWRFSRRWAAGARYEFGSSNPSIDAHRHRTSAALTFWPSEFSRLRLQGASDVLSIENATDRRDWAVLLALEVLIGAHGAHAF